MKRYPKIGTRVRITAGEYAGRQARTVKTVGGRGRIELDLLGGVMLVGVSVRLEDVERDTERKIRKLEARPIRPGDRLWSLSRDIPWPTGRFMTILESAGSGAFYVRTDYGQRMTLVPTPGFEKRWAILDGTPIQKPTEKESDER